MTVVKLWRRRREVAVEFPRPVLLGTKTDDVFFEAAIEASFKPGSPHSHPMALVRSRLFDMASTVAKKWEVDQAWLAEDELNGLLGLPTDCPNRFYLGLRGSVRLYSSPESIDRLERVKADRERIGRLNFLKSSLYSDPSLVAIDYFERNPVSPIEFDSLLQRTANLSNSLRGFDVWWGPVMAAWGELAAKTQSQREIDVALRILLEALSRLDSSLVAKHGLQDFAE